MEEEISLVELFEVLKKRLSMIISLSLIGLILAAIFTFFIATPKYSATTQLLVNQTTGNTEGIQLNDITTNVQMINTYRDIIKGPVILDDVAETLNLDSTVGQLANQIEVVTQDNSQVFSLNITSENPYVASDIANTTASIFQDEVGNIMNVENVTIISEAVPNTNPVSPNNLLNLTLGLLLGAILGVGAAFLFEFMDKSVKDERFITETLGWSTLGNVSEMTHDELNAKLNTMKTNTVKRRSKARV
ncbi:chain-length determining protein [Desemzia sp. RIT804]|uniref:YveK family protein n=1 Tax=Desemzia sp. RIT 804 TaxID=2810209 RepID=UPI00195270FB|nr:Wzz/FepE/Etk N-terminal domain-containing protein [Desemzia sp. RIT 804]MBM6615375.1 chain-length determining protein [Desemzia sp. RIT 804]